MPEGITLYVEEGWPEGTGPSEYTRALVRDRAGYYCEWLACRTPGTDIHHRLNRKAGGRNRAGHERVNSPAYLLLACRHHHDLVTSAYGPRLREARDRGWLLTEDLDGEAVPVLTRHRPEPVWLLTDGTWWPTTLPHPTLTDLED